MKYSPNTQPRKQRGLFLSPRKDTPRMICYQILMHYALNITDDSDTGAYVSPKTLCTMRSIFSGKSLYVSLFESMTDKLARLFDVDAQKQRYDSMHIFSNMRHLGRIGLFVSTIKKFLVNLKRYQRELFDGLEKEITDRHTTKDGQARFSMVKPSEYERTLKFLG